MQNIIKHLISNLPERYQQELKKIYYFRQIRIGKFLSYEKEYTILDSFISSGDWVLDIGANIGHYTARFSELVGEEGRVFAFEPVPLTFELLVANSRYFKYRNVTFLNIGASDLSKIINIEVPNFKSGLKNYYRAHITNNKTNITSMIIPIDNIEYSHTVKLVKIDAEGHEYSVVRGMNKMILRDHPILIIETNSGKVIEYLKTLGYSMNKLEKSDNCIFQH